MTRIVLIRHGRALCADRNIVGGPSGCTGLSPLGTRQAEALRDRLRASGELRADVVVVSALPRASETAAIILPAVGGAELIEDCDACEWHPGEADGLTYDAVRERWGDDDFQANPDRVPVPGAESYNAFRARVGGLLERLARDHASGTVVVVCHGGVIVHSVLQLLAAPAHGLDADGRAHLDPHNTSITEWTHDGSRWGLERYNDHAHLTGDLSPAAS